MDDVIYDALQLAWRLALATNTEQSLLLADILETLKQAYRHEALTPEMELKIAVIVNDGLRKKI